MILAEILPGFTLLLFIPAILFFRYVILDFCFDVTGNKAWIWAIVLTALFSLAQTFCEEPVW